MQFEKGKIPDGAIPFEKGKSGNPTGRPKSAISQYLREYGDAAELRLSIEKVDTAGKVTQQQFSLSTSDQTINRTIAALMLMKALKGDIRMIQEVLKRTEGRPPHSSRTRGPRPEGAELKVWTPEEVDEFLEWKRQRDTITTPPPTTEMTSDH